MAKNIVICFDGTGNQIRAAENTSVVRGYDMVVHDPGVGTDPAIGTYAPSGQLVARTLAIAFGVGLRAKLAQAYTYLIEWWQPLAEPCPLCRQSVRAVVPKLISRAVGPAALFLTHRGKFAIPIAYLGLWDTVSAPGIFKRSMQWPYATSVPHAEAGRHAVAIDEKRRPYCAQVGDRRCSRTWADTQCREIPTVLLG
ncbi:uncharacterized protein (DUF2235 family) [Mycobacteroides chelonae]|nr:uncharacterized protein (DUF2235 family) [Mycobacteroides chelonae]